LNVESEERKREKTGYGAVEVAKLEKPISLDRITESKLKTKMG
jgi:hypothetical protein